MDILEMGGNGWMVDNGVSSGGIVRPPYAGFKGSTPHREKYFT